VDEIQLEYDKYLGQHMDEFYMKMNNTTLPLIYK